MTYTPGVERGVDTQKAKGNENAPDNISAPAPAEDPVAVYGDHLRVEDELQEKIEDAKEGIESDHDSIEKLRGAMGLLPDPNLETASDKHISALEQQEAMVEETIQKEERDILDYPEGQGENEQSKQNRAEVAQIEEQGVQAEKEAREEFVQEFIRAAIVKMEEHFGSFLDESKNGGKARQLMRQKIGVEVEYKAKDFIEHGGEPDFDFEMKLAGAEFDGPEGKKVQYVTEVNMIFDDKAPTNVAESNDLIDQPVREQMQEAEKQGNLSEAEKETA